MPTSLPFLLHTVPEPWSDADHREWHADLHLHGFIHEGTWLAPTLKGPRIPVDIHAAPEEGRFTFTMDADAWRARPEHAARVVIALVRVLSGRVECRFATGPDPEAQVPTPPPTLDVLHGLGTVTVLGAPLVERTGAVRFDALPGLIAEPLPHGAMLLYPPLEGLPASRTPALHDMFLHAETHLGVHGPALTPQPLARVACSPGEPGVQDAQEGAPGA